ncbi:MAG: TfoX/Sxy family protein [Bacteroidia bacterium]|nr:TfoX/Sxy family protein [Bacteroidia bacterium]
MAKKPDYPHLEMLELYESLVAEIPDLQRKGKANPYTSLNGNMFTFLDKQGKLSLRLPKDVQQDLLENHGGQPSIQYGSVMRDYVLLPQKIIDDRNCLSELIKQSYEYAKRLKPKPTKRK